MSRAIEWLIFQVQEWDFDNVPETEIVFKQQAIAASHELAELRRRLALAEAFAVADDALQRGRATLGKATTDDEVEAIVYGGLADLNRNYAAARAALTWLDEEQ